MRLTLTLSRPTELYVSAVLMLLGWRGLILHEFMLENISDLAVDQGAAPTGASEHGNTLREATSEGGNELPLLLN